MNQSQPPSPRRHAPLRNPRHHGISAFYDALTIHRQLFSDYGVGLWQFKLKLGIVQPPWWVSNREAAGGRITDTRRLLAASVKPTPASRYQVCVDLAHPNHPDSVAVRETFSRPTPEFPHGSYKLEIAGKVVRGSGCWAEKAREQGGVVLEDTVMYRYIPQLKYGPTECKESLAWPTNADWDNWERIDS